MLQEVVNGAKQFSYVYGDDLLSQARASDVSYYVYDGQGSVRSLTNQAGVQTDSYHYDAFGILLHSEGGTPNSYLYTGEQYDASLDQYYLRARYYDQNQGRFTQMDTWMGINSDPVTLHKYLYANADPVGHIDPTGNMSLEGHMAGIGVMGTLLTLTLNQYQVGQSFANGRSLAGGRYTDQEIGWLTLASSSPKLMSLISVKAKTKDNSQKIVPLARAVEDVELASLYTCNCFALGPNMWPKQFFNTVGEAHKFGGDYLLGKLKIERYHIVEVSISESMRRELRDSYEPGIGPIVEVPNELLPAFNADMKLHGGWTYTSTHP
nr:RHS repeat-associated core domain-containing protein [Hahella chejuensis]